MSPATRVHQEDSGTPPPRSLRVLVVDDNRDLVTTTIVLLRQDGHEAKGCYGGTEAYDLIQEYDPDVVILDIGLPGMSGWEIARRVRARFPGGRPILIAITGEFVKGADKVLGKLAGFDYYLIKPVDPNVLSTLLANARPQATPR